MSPALIKKAINKNVNYPNQKPVLLCVRTFVWERS